MHWRSHKALKFANVFSARFEGVMSLGGHKRAIHEIFISAKIVYGTCGSFVQYTLDKTVCVKTEVVRLGLSAAGNVRVCAREREWTSFCFIDLMKWQTPLSCSPD